MRPPKGVFKLSAVAGNMIAIHNVAASATVGLLGVGGIIAHNSNTLLYITEFFAGLIVFILFQILDLKILSQLI